MRSVSVIGIGETKMGKLVGQSIKDLIADAGNKAILDAGIDKTMIQALYLGNFNAGYWSLQSHMGPMASDILGLGNIPAVRTEGACASGSLAFRQGYIAVSAGVYDIVLVAVWKK